ncbi:MAG: replication restart helicase PriA [Saccharofermentanales bacterium]
MNVKVVLKESTIEFDKEYTYSVPAEMRQAICTGARVFVPFGKTNVRKEGYVLSLSDDDETDFYVKPVLEICQPCPALRDDQIHLARQMRKKYTCTYGDAIRLMIPSQGATADKTTRTAYLIDPQEAVTMIEEGEFNKINQIRVIELLLECEQAPVPEICSACQVTQSTLTTLAKKNVIAYGKIPAKANDDIQEDVLLQEPMQRTGEQQVAIEAILGADIERFNEYLLHGITGSGKTEVYLQVIQSLTDKGFGAILMVPEISLTPQMIFRMKARFGDGVCVIHSRLTPKERYDQWKAIMEDRVRIVIGARSAVFSPVNNLKIIIIDEEQETTYKSETHPKYNAIDIARMRMKYHDGILLLGSATPNIETYYRTQAGESILLRLTQRIGGARLPDVGIIDLREELASGNRNVFSRILKQKMLDAFEKKEQVILFLNRRGHSGFYLCRDCGYVPKCPSCSVSFTFHSANNAMICHYCGLIHQVPKKCPVCGSPRIGGFGAGTQKIEELCRTEFPDRVILRMDQDTTTGRGSHARILGQFGDGTADLLIGTQMIAKGHDFPNVTVVGILSADLMLGISDFRSSERAFQLITQAAGRAGRGDKAGSVIIQAYNVDDYAVTFAAKQDYEGFYKQEIAFRQAMGYPPFGVIGLIVISSMNEKSAIDTAKKVRSELMEIQDEQNRDGTDARKIEIMDLSKAPVYKIRDRYRLRIIIKGHKEEDIAFYFAKIQNTGAKEKVMISFDINPYHML